MNHIIDRRTKTRMKNFTRNPLIEEFSSHHFPFKGRRYTFSIEMETDREEGKRRLDGGQTSIIADAEMSRRTLSLLPFKWRGNEESACRRANVSDGEK